MFSGAVRHVSKLFVPNSLQVSMGSPLTISAQTRSKFRKNYVNHSQCADMHRREEKTRSRPLLM